MSAENVCPQCHATLPPDAPAGLCPRCLIRSAAGLAEPPPNVDFPDIGDAADVAKRLPQFEIIEMLGRGGMGVVYKARQPALDRLVALKILPPSDALSPDFLERFRREARSLAKLNHANIVHVYDFGEAGGLFYIVMEFVDGANLRQLFETGKFTPAEALAIVPRICDALEYAHEEGLVHRDIKPENLLIDKKGRVKIADFGLAKLLRREPLDVSLTLSGMSLGTMRYMAPEQMDKPETVDHRADIYSLGVVIYEMLTGEVPMGHFELPSQKAHVDVRLDEIVLHALEREPARRYQHASQIKTDVENVTSKPEAKPAVEKPTAIDERILEVLRRDKIAAIRLHRELTGSSLADAKEAVETIARAHGVQPQADAKRTLINRILPLIFGMALLAGWGANGNAPGTAKILIVAAGLALGLVLLIASALAERRQKSEATQNGSEPAAAPSPLENDPAAKARASWFGRRSERFRTLFPMTFIFLEIACLVAGLAGWPSPWLEWTRTFTPGKHGAISSASTFAFHPFTISFFLIAAGLAIGFASVPFGRMDNLIRFGRRWRDVRGDIRRKARRKIIGCGIAAMLAPSLVFILFPNLSSVGTQIFRFRLSPNSKAYEQLLLEVPFSNLWENGTQNFRRANRWEISIGLKSRDATEPVMMDIAMPSLEASYDDPSWSNAPHQIVLDLAELTAWMSKIGKVDVQNEKAKAEAGELMTLLKTFSRRAPANMDEFSISREDLMPDFSPLGFESSSMNFSENGAIPRIIGVYVLAAIFFVALYLVVALRIQRAAFELDRAVLKRGESVLADAPLPRARFRELPKEIRRRTIQRAVFAAVGLLVLPGLVWCWQTMQPQRVKHDYHEDFAPPPDSPLLKHFQLLTMNFAFESYQQRNESWFVQPNPFQLELKFSRPKISSEREASGVRYEAGKGVFDGETFSLIVEMPSLRARLRDLPGFPGIAQMVTLDEEELLRWMQHGIAAKIAPSTAAPVNSEAAMTFTQNGKSVLLLTPPLNEVPELKTFAADVMTLLKKYATVAPSTDFAFEAAVRKTLPLDLRGSTAGTSEESANRIHAIGAALAASTLAFFALLPPLKRSAIRAAIQQGTLDLAPRDEIKSRKHRSETEQKRSLATWQIAACVLGIGGCLWPYSFLYRTFLGQTQTREIMTEPGVAILGEIGLPAYLPAAKAGIVVGDRLLTIGGRPVHVMGLDNPDSVWKQTPVGGDVKITVLRNGETMTLDAVRSPDPVVVIFYAVWQFIAGFCFLIFIVFALLSQPHERAARFRGVAAAILGLILIASQLLDGGSNFDRPAKEIWNVLQHGYDYSPPTFGQKLAANAAAISLLLLGVMEIRLSLAARKKSAEE